MQKWRFIFTDWLCNMELCQSESLTLAHNTLTKRCFCPIACEECPENVVLLMVYLKDLMFLLLMGERNMTGSPETEAR